MKNLTLAALLMVSGLVTGCATSSHVITGTPRPAYNADAVKVYATMPEKAEVIGIVTAQNDTLYRQSGLNSVIKKLKSEAAKLGANGLLLTSQNQSAWTGTQASGTAIYVP